MLVEEAVTTSWCKHKLKTKGVRIWVCPRPRGGGRHPLTQEDTGTPNGLPWSRELTPENLGKSDMETLDTLPICLHSPQSEYMVFQPSAIYQAGDAHSHTAHALWCSEDLKEHLGGQCYSATPQQWAFVTSFPREVETINLDLTDRALGPREEIIPLTALAKRNLREN